MTNKLKFYMSYLEWLGDIKWEPAEMIHCIQIDHFLSAVVCQGALLRLLMELTPKGKKNNNKKGIMAFFRFIVITISSTEEPADGNMPAAFFPPGERDQKH